MTRGVLVTGGAGFIGSHLVERLAAEGWSVRVLDDLSSGRESNLAGPGGGVELLRGDVCDGSLLARAMDGVDVVFHLAAIPSVVRSIHEPERTSAVNLGGTLAVLEAARRAGVRRVILASSAAIYGDGESLPCVESLPAACLSPYALQKYASEGYLSLYSRIHGLETVSLRFFNVFGPRQDPEGDYASVIPIFVSHAISGKPIHLYGDGEQTRDFVYVGDVVEANWLAATREGLSNAVLNVASGHQTSVNDLIQGVAQCAAVEIEVVREPARPGEVRYSWADVTRAADVLGYAPRVALEDGLSKTFEAFRGAAS